VTKKSQNQPREVYNSPSEVEFLSARSLKSKIEISLSYRTINIGVCYKCYSTDNKRGGETRKRQYKNKGNTKQKQDGYKTRAKRRIK